jgi:hypothetical protein
MIHDYTQKPVRRLCSDLSRRFERMRKSMIPLLWVLPVTLCLHCGADDVLSPTDVDEPLENRVADTNPHRAPPAAAPPTDDPDSSLPITSDLSALLHIDPPRGSLDFLVQAAVAVGSQWGGAAFVGGVRAQTEVISRDAQARPDAIQVIAPVPAGTTEIDLTATGNGPSTNQYHGRDLSEIQLHIHTANALSGVDDIFVAQPISSEGTVLRDGIWLRETRHWAQFHGVHDPDTSLMGVHTYVTQRSDAEVYEITMAISNATASASGEGANGEVYFDKITLSLDGLPTDWKLFTVLPRASMNLDASPPEIVSSRGVDPLGQPSYHFMAARAGLVRRFIIAHKTHASLAADLLNRRGTGRATGVDSYYSRPAFGETGMRIPTLGLDFSFQGHTGLEAARLKALGHLDAVREGLALGTARPYLGDLKNDAQGWFHPRGEPNGQNVGGTWIHPTSGSLFVREAWLLNDAWMQTERDRSSVAAYDPPSGALISTQMLAAANPQAPGKLPFGVSNAHGQLCSQLPWFVHPEALGAPWDGSHCSPQQPNSCQPIGLPWNTLPVNASSAGEASQKYYKNLYSGYSWWDAQHAIRGLSAARVSIWALNDSYAKDYLKIWANHWQHSWSHLPIEGASWVLKHHASLQNLKEKILTDNTHHQGGRLGRGHAWVTTFQAARYAIETDTWRAANKPWFELATEVFHLSAMPTTFIMDRITSLDWAPHNTMVFGNTALPVASFDAAQTFEQAFLCHASYAMLHRVFHGDSSVLTGQQRGEEILRDIIIGQARAVHGTYAPGPQADGPPKYLLVAEHAGAPLTPLQPWTFKMYDAQTGQYGTSERETVYGKYHLMLAYRLDQDSWYLNRLRQMTGGNPLSSWLKTAQEVGAQNILYNHVWNNSAALIAELQSILP